jgi:hypothetical protein
MFMYRLTPSLVAYGPAAFPAKLVDCALTDLERQMA